MSTSKFPLGMVVCTLGAQKAINGEELRLLQLLARHANGDWGDLTDSDKKANDEAINIGNRILSVYEIEPGLRLWIITEADRSATTFLLPNEY